MLEEEEEPEGVEIRDTETNEGVDWYEIFFRLHHYCNLNKWEIMEYTLPQITALMKMTNKHIQFEVETRMAPLGLFGGVSSDDGNNNNNDEFREATEEDIRMLEQFLSGM